MEEVGARYDLEGLRRAPGAERPEEAGGEHIVTSVTSGRRGGTPEP